MTNPDDPVYPVKAYRVAIPKHLLTPELLVGMKEIEEPIPGLTKREYFAAMAMSALVIHREVQLDYESKLPADVIAIMALAQADALIKELSKVQAEEKSNNQEGANESL